MQFAETMKEEEKLNDIQQLRARKAEDSEVRILFLAFSRLAFQSTAAGCIQSSIYDENSF